MNFVVSFALVVIVGSIAIWRMSRNDDVESEGEDSKAVSIEVINGDSNEDNGEDVTADAVADVVEEADEKIVIEQENEPQSRDAVEEVVEEIVLEQEDEPQSDDVADVESEEEAVEEIISEQEDELQSNDGSDVDAAESVEAESTSAEDTEEDLEELQQIIGIGPTYARRIYDAGITSIEALSELTGESLQQIVTPGKSTPTSETENWLEQARQLAS